MVFRANDEKAVTSSRTYEQAMSRIEMCLGCQDHCIEALV